MIEAAFISHSRSEPASEAAAVLLEARSDPRVAVDFPVHVWGNDFDGSLAGWARDLSVGGVCMTTETIFAFKSLRRVALTLPAGVLELPVAGRWQGEGGDRSILTGMAFDSPRPEDVAHLWDVVNTAGKELGLSLYRNADLGGLSADDAMSVAQATRFRFVEAGRAIYRQDVSRAGDDSIFVVHRGQVSLRYRFGPAREVTFERLEPGRVFGGLPIVAETPNPETALADRDAVLLEIPAPAFSYMRVSRPLLAQKLTRAVGRCQTARMRWLLELSKQGG